MAGLENGTITDGRALIIAAPLGRSIDHWKSETVIVTAIIIDRWDLRGTRDNEGAWMDRQGQPKHRLPWSCMRSTILGRPFAWEVGKDSIRIVDELKLTIETWSCGSPGG